MKKVVIVGGGAAGFFAAINAKEHNPNLDIIILEKSSQVLQKVKISGGGRCNVTHACFDPKELTQFYPRGAKELLGPFHQFMTGDTFEWFEKKGILLKIEEDNRVFPESNSSQTIIDCFLSAVDNLGITVLKNHGVTTIEKEENKWLITTKKETFIADKLIVASGSSKKGWELASKLGHTIIDPVPSLFTFNIKDTLITDLGGISVPNAEVTISDSSLHSSGPLLITHWGLSGPAILKLSAYGARTLANKNYQYEVSVNWLGKSLNEVTEIILNLKKEHPKKQVVLKSAFTAIPRRLWERFTQVAAIKKGQNWADLSNHQIQTLAQYLTKTQFKANGRTTFKEEFVTAGGIHLKEINFKRFESKLHKNLFFIGEVLNIDAITGGFNFQNAWTGAYLCAQAIASDS